MLKSMTGFGSASIDDGTYKIGVEIKAVNNRYRDISVRLPGNLRPLEKDIMTVLNEYCQRGKIDVFINFTDNSEGQKQLSVDKSLLIAYYGSLCKIREIIKNTACDKLKKPSLEELAVYPGIIKEQDSQLDIEAVRPLLVQAVQAAAEDFVQMRLSEGENLSADIKKRLRAIAIHTAQIEEIAPTRLKEYRIHLQETVQSLLQSTEVDESRIVQECAIMADKLDITEELVRMRSHLEQFNEALCSDGSIGRKMDFIVQEMNRETNTMASKANNARIAALVVEIKGEIEKIREQVQNIE